MTQDNLLKFLSDLEGRAFKGESARNQKIGARGALTIAVNAFEDGARWQHEQDKRTIKLLCEVVRAQSEALCKYLQVCASSGPTGGDWAARDAQATVAGLIAEYEKGTP